MATLNMNLTLPVPTSTLGPEWATQLNTALETVDAHDHSSGKGKKVPVSGLNINADLDFSNFKISSLFSVQFQSNLSALSGATNSNGLSVTNGNLYFTNGSGVPIQLTSGGAIVSSPGAVISLETASINSNLVISPSDTFVFIIVDTSASRTITLPLASAVATGRMYLIKDRDGLSNTNPITVQTSGLDTIDGASSVDIASNNATAWIISDGIDGWYLS